MAFVEGVNRSLPMLSGDTSIPVIGLAHDLLYRCWISIKATYGCVATSDDQANQCCHAVASCNHSVALHYTYFEIAH